MFVLTSMALPWDYYGITPESVFEILRKKIFCFVMCDEELFSIVTTLKFVSVERL